MMKNNDGERSVREIGIELTSIASKYQVYETANNDV